MDVINILFSSLIVLILSAILYVKRSFSYWKSLNVPYDEPIFPYGNSKGLGKTMTILQFMNKYYTQFKGTTKMCGLYFLLRPVGMILDLDLIKNVLVKEFPSFNDRNFYYNEKDDPLSAHLVSLDGKNWKNVRTKMTPTFSSGKMKYMFSTIRELGDHLNDYLCETIKTTNELDIKNITSRFTMDVIGTCAFGIECNTLNDTNNDFYRIGRMAMEKPRHNPRFSFLLSDIKPLARFLGIKIIRDEVSTFFMNVVRSTIEYREKNHIQRNDFMNLLMKLKTDENDGDLSKGLTVNQIAAQSFLFFAAGYETSSTTMLFTLYELALNQDIQTKLREEIQQAMEKYGDFTYEMMMDIPYLDQVINETLRKYPPFIALRRMAQNNYKVPGTNMIIEKGTSVIIPVYAIHHDPEYYPEPEKYDPDRFSPDETKKRHPMAWLAFGEGPRNCIAMRFGMMETRIGIISLLRSFKFLPCTGTLIPMVFGRSPIVLSPKNCIHLKIERIE